MSDDSEHGEVEIVPVGYGCPPRDHRFKRGQSGNPSGRPRERRTLYHTLQEMLEERVNGKNGRIMSGEDIIAARIIEGAMAGEPKAFRKFLELARRANLFEDLSGARKRQWSDNPIKDLQFEVENLRAKLKKYDDVVGSRGETNNE
jgi:uncharacterized protein DUF5681